jgi:hypothetical protein
MIPGSHDSTAPIAVKRQPFLDNVVAQFGRLRAKNDRPDEGYRDMSAPQPRDRCPKKGPRAALRQFVSRIDNDAKAENCLDGYKRTSPTEQSRFRHAARPLHH